MPWTKDNVDEFKKGLTEKQKSQWVKIANSALESCLNEGGDKKECEVSAIKQANGSVGNNMEKYNRLNNNYQMRYAQHQGKTHIVLPVVMMVEGVHRGSHGSMLHTSEELGKFPAAWNGMPIVVEHPQDDSGRDISANNPEVIDNETVGRVYNTHIEEGKLKAEAWLDKNRLQDVSPEAFSCVEDQKPLDVSVGVFSDEELASGQWNGDSYEAIARNHRPDHLALLPGGQGACSWEDGCGIGKNEKKGGRMKRTRNNPAIVSNYELVINELSYSGTENTDWSAPDLEDFGVDSNWSDLDKSKKADVAGHFLIGSSSAESFSELHYPVVNPSTGKLNENALRAVISGRGAALEGVPSDTKSAARRRAYRLLNEQFNADLDVPEDLNAYSSQELDEMKEILQKNGYKIVKQKNDSTMTKEEKVDKVISTNQKFGSDDKDWLSNLKDEQLDKMLPDETQNNNCCPDKVDRLIANSKFTEDDKEWLLSQKEETIDKMFPEQTQNNEDNNEDGNDEDEGDKEVVTKDAVKQVFSQYKKSEDFIKDFVPDELKDQLTDGLKLYREKRKNMISEIQDNSSEFSEKELQGMENAMLEKIYNSVVPESNYAPMGGSGPSNNSKGPQTILLPTEARKDEFKQKKQ